MPAETRYTTEGEPARTYPDNPDCHDALHIAPALDYHPVIGWATIVWRDGRGFEDFVGAVDVKEQVGETEDWDNGAHLVGFSVVVSPVKF